MGPRLLRRAVVALFLLAVISMALPNSTGRITGGEQSITITVHHHHHHRYRCRKHRHRRCRKRHHKKTIVPKVPKWPWPEPAGNWTQPTDFSYSTGGFTFNCGTDASVGATVNFCKNGAVAGVYIDDTTPDVAHWVGLAVVKYKLVVVGQAPNGPCAAQGDAICAQEWYPYDCRFPPGTWGPIPAAKAYIIQWWYAWPGCGPPTPIERAALLSDVEALKPILILGY